MLFLFYPFATSVSDAGLREKIGAHRVDKLQSTTGTRRGPLSVVFLAPKGVTWQQSEKVAVNVVGSEEKLAKN